MKDQTWDRPDGRYLTWIDEDDVFSTTTGQKCAVLRDGTVYDLQGEVIDALTSISAATTSIEPGQALEKFVRLADAEDVKRP